MALRFLRKQVYFLTGTKYFYTTNQIEHSYHIRIAGKHTNYRWAQGVRGLTILGPLNPLETDLPPPPTKAHRGEKL